MLYLCIQQMAGRQMNPIDNAISVDGWKACQQRRAGVPVLPPERQRRTGVPVGPQERNCWKVPAAEDPKPVKASDWLLG